MKINSTESYVFCLALTYRARIKLSFINTRGIQYSPYINLVSRLTGFQIWLSGRNTSILMNIKIGILNVPKPDNKHDLIHFVTMCELHSWYIGSAWLKDWPNQVYVGHWPIFYGPKILLHILETIWWRNIVWHKDWPLKIDVGQWPIFHEPLILPFIIVIDLNYLYTLRNGAGRGYSCLSRQLL